jgi:hypothetical protein
MMVCPSTEEGQSCRQQAVCPCFVRLSEISEPATLILAAAAACFAFLDIACPLPMTMTAGGTKKIDVVVDAHDHDGSLPILYLSKDNIGGWLWRSR